MSFLEFAVETNLNNAKKQQLKVQLQNYSFSRNLFAHEDYFFLTDSQKYRVMLLPQISENERNNA